MTTEPCDENLRITGGAEGSAPPLSDEEKQVLTFNLKKEWYEKIKRGDKTVEYREVKPYWTKRIESLLDESAHPNTTTAQLMEWLNSGQPIKFIYCPYSAMLRLGYTKKHMTADITKIEVVDGKDTDLAIDAPVYAIHLADVREAGK